MQVRIPSLSSLHAHFYLHLHFHLHKQSCLNFPHCLACLVLIYVIKEPCSLSTPRASYCQVLLIVAAVAHVAGTV
jgi:hypothetical protein